jgi:hypothetical protein
MHGMTLSVVATQKCSRLFLTREQPSFVHAHKAPVPEPTEDPLPGEHPVPQDEPVPSPNPEVDDFKPSNRLLAASTLQ